jgi:phosphatidate phosphatase APP1
MTSWLAAAARLAAAVEGGVDRAVFAARDRLGYPLPPRIVPYRGYGTRRSVLLLGRVLRDAPLPPSPEGASVWSNLLATYHRMETDEVPGARVRTTLEGVSRETYADQEGYFECQMPAAAAGPAVGPWIAAEAELLDPRDPAAPPPVVLPALVPPASARFGVVSDMDDTVVRTDATQLLRMARTVFLGNARTRLPFPGVAAFYRALEAGPPGSKGIAGNPLFYVSSSPWNLYELLVEFLELQKIPLGPIVLRDWGLTPEGFVPATHATHKLAAIRRIFATYPELPFILVGDSGQEDPEIYAEVIREFPNRVLAAYIRNVTTEEARRAAVRKLGEDLAGEGRTLLLADDTLSAAKHAAANGWIDAAALPEVGQEAEKDR